MESQTALGLKFKVGKYRIRIWKYGFEWSNGMIGRVKFFPWHPKARYK